MPGGHCISNIYARSFPNPSSWPWPSEVETGNLTWLEETESSEKHVKHKASCVSTFWEDVWEWSCWSCVNYTLQFRDHHRASQVSWLYSAGTDKGYKVFDDCIRTNTWHCRSLRVKPFCWVFGFNPPHPITEMLNVFGTDCLATRCRCGAELSHLLASRGVARLLLGWKSYLALSTSFIFYSAVLKYSIPAYSV